MRRLEPFSCFPEASQATAVRLSCSRPPPPCAAMLAMLQQGAETRSLPVGRDAPRVAMTVSKLSVDDSFFSCQIGQS